MKNILLSVFTILFSIQSYAEGQVNSFNVVTVRADKNGNGYIKFDKEIAGTPASCGNTHSYHLAFDLNTPGGRGIMSIALAAQASGKKMIAKGTGSCDVYSVVESWSWGYVIN